jgi:hypothetical protein
VPSLAALFASSRTYTTRARGGFFAQKSACLGLDESEEVAYSNVLVQLIAVVVGERTGARLGGEFVDARLVKFGKLEREQETRDFGGRVRHVPNHAFEYGDFAVQKHKKVVLLPQARREKIQNLVA